jgi:hypothetical protein
MTDDLRRFTTLLLATLFLISPSAFGQKKNWTQWSLGDAEKVVLKATKASQIGTGELFAQGMLGGLAGGAKLSGIRVTWLTDPVVRALVRATQIKERLTNAEATALYEKLRSELKDSYAFIVSAGSLLFLAHGGAYTSEEIVETSNRNRIFLQYPHDQKVFLRPARIEGSLVTVPPLSSLFQLPSPEQDAIIFFPRDANFIQNSKGEVEYQMVQEGKERKVKFKIKDLVEDRDML